MAGDSLHVSVLQRVQHPNYRLLKRKRKRSGLETAQLWKALVLAGNLSSILSTCGGCFTRTCNFTSTESRVLFRPLWKALTRAHISSFNFKDEKLDFYQKWSLLCYRRHLEEIRNKRQRLEESVCNSMCFLKNLHLEHTETLKAQ